ncbi:MAG: hypothetical protein M3R55_00095 [Acidobacteriota bacterium]|nr:hypothetical protein [Acidobacteriota bacterium]
MTVTKLLSLPRAARRPGVQSAHAPVFGDGAPGSVALSRPAVADLFYRVRCAIFRMHDFQVKVVPGRVCLACHHCGKRSMGWEMGPPMGVVQQTATIVPAGTRAASLDQVPMRMAKVLHHASRVQQKRAAAN